MAARRLPTSPAEAAAEAHEPVVPSADLGAEVREKVERVSRVEVEELLASVVRVVLQGGLAVRHPGNGTPGIDVSLTEDVLSIDVHGLDRALAWRLAGPEEVGPPGVKEQVLDRFRIFLYIDGALIAALGRGVPGVQVRTGRASLLLLRDFLKGILGDRRLKRELRRQRHAERESKLLEAEIERSRERAGAEAGAAAEVAPEEAETLPPPLATRIHEERRRLREGRR